MSYKSMESGLLTVVQLLSNYSSANSSQGDYRKLGGGNQRVVVLQPGAILAREVVQAQRRVRTAWVVNIEVFVAWRGEKSTTETAMRDDRQEILDHVDKYPTLNGTSNCINAFIVGAGEPEAWRGENKRWWVQVLRCVVEERVTVTIAE